MSPMPAMATAPTTASKFATDAVVAAAVTKPEELPEEEEEEDKELEAADSLEGDLCTLTDMAPCCLGDCSSFPAVDESSGPVAVASPVTAGHSKWTQWNTSFAVLCVPTILM